jgi:arylsulfatase
MTEMWQQKGVWEAYQADFEERFSNKAHVVRPSVLPLEEYADVYVGQQAKTYLEKYNRDQPWFCWVSFGGPHEPWDTPEPYASQYRPENMPDPVSAPNHVGARPRGLLDQRLENGQVDFQPGEEKRLRANYAGNISLIDDQIGEILDVLETRGDLDNTFIVLVSDHGEMNGDYGFIYKEHLLNGSVRVPLLVRTPKRMGSHLQGTVCDSPVEWMDVGPTMVEWAGGELSHQQFGKSLCPTLADPAKEHRSEAISEYGGEVMVLNRQWKAVLNRQGQVYLLFDVAEDPNEVNNLAGQPEFGDVERTLRLRILERPMTAQVTSGMGVQAKE